MIPLTNALETFVPVFWPLRRPFVRPPVKFRVKQSEIGSNLPKMAVVNRLSGPTRDLRRRALSLLPDEAIQIRNLSLARSTTWHIVATIHYESLTSVTLSNVCLENTMTS